MKEKQTAYYNLAVDLKQFSPLISFLYTDRIYLGSWEDKLICGL